MFSTSRSRELHFPIHPTSEAVSDGPLNAKCVGVPPAFQGHRCQFSWGGMEPPIIFGNHCGSSFAAIDRKQYGEGCELGEVAVLLFVSFSSGFCIDVLR
eukprot:5431499-Amphidinium_carterae.1